jgi:hypothetical protein
LYLEAAGANLKKILGGGGDAVPAHLPDKSPLSLCFHFSRPTEPKAQSSFYVRTISRFSILSIVLGTRAIDGSQCFVWPDKHVALPIATGPLHAALYVTPSIESRHSKHRIEKEALLYCLFVVFASLALRIRKNPMTQSS